MRNPSFLAAHPKGQFLYAVGELNDFQGKRAGAVSAFALEARTGRLRLLNQQLSGGQGPCHLALDSKGRCVLVANYGSGSVAAFPVQKDGGLAEAAATIQHTGSSVNPQRQTGPHAHHILVDRDDRHALVCDLGLDKVLVYRLDAKLAALVANDPPSAAVSPGAGPRHLTFSPNGKYVCVINELNSTITVFAYDARRGVLTQKQTISTLPENLLDAAVLLCKTFSEEVPIVDSGSMRYKLARLAAALAVRTFSVEDKHTILVRNCHIEYITRLLYQIYSSTALGYAEYSKAVFKAEQLIDPNSIRQRILNNTPFPKDFIVHLLATDEIDIRTIQDILGWPMNDARDLLAFLNRHHALIRKGRVYHKTTGFTRLLKEMENEDGDGRPIYIPEEF